MPATGATGRVRRRSATARAKAPTRAPSLAPSLARSPDPWPVRSLSLSLVLPLVLGTANAVAQSLPAETVDPDPDRSRRTLPSVVAEHVARHEPSGIELGRARLELAPEGLRARRDGAGGALELLQDFVDGRVWLIDHRRGVSHALAPVDLADPDADADTVGDASLPSPWTGSGLLGPRPCAGRPSRALGTGRWRGRRVSAHRCLAERAGGASGGTASVAIELVDREHGIVVYRRDANGRVDALQGLRAARFPASHFVPPARLRAVDAREFALGAPALGTFDETLARGSESRGPHAVRAGITEPEDLPETVDRIPGRTTPRHQR